MSLPNNLTFPAGRPGPTWQIINADNPLSIPVAGQFDPKVQENKGPPIWQKRPGIAGAPPWLKFVGRNVSELTFEFYALAINSLDQYPILAWNRLNQLAEIDETLGRPPRIIFKRGPLIAEGYLTSIPFCPMEFWGGANIIRSELVREVGPVRLTITRIPKDPADVSLFTSYVRNTDQTTFENLSRLQYGDARYAQSLAEWNQGRAVGEELELPRKSSGAVDTSSEPSALLSDSIEGL